MDALPRAESKSPEPGLGRASVVCALGSPDEVLAVTSAIAKGDERAFDRFYAAFFDRLHRYLLLRSGGREEAVRDALQEAMLRVIRYMKPFPDNGALWNWLRRIAASALIDQVRKEQKLPRALTRTPDALEAKPGDEDPDAVLERILSDCLAALSTEERGLVEGKYFEGRSHDAMAIEAGVSPKAVESRLSRIRKKLRSMILERLKDA
jgi:RNA polymerase sigma factor (sigma-70 family)